MTSSCCDVVWMPRGGWGFPAKTRSLVSLLYRNNTELWDDNGDTKN